MRHKTTVLFRLLRGLNRPLPAWLTLCLIFGAVAGAAVPVFNGSINLLTGATITDTNATANSCVGANASKQYEYNADCVHSVTAGSNISPMTGPTPTVAVTANPSFGTVLATTLKSAPAAGSNATLQLTSAGSNAAVANLDSANTESIIRLNNDGSGLGSLVNVGAVIAQTPSGNCGGATIAQFDLLTAGNATHPGGAMTFHTSDDSGTCADAENLVLTADHHAYMPYDQYYTQFNTPASCTQFVPCGTVTWTFTYAYHNTSGGLNQPDCTAATIRDDNSTSRAWVVNIQSISATAVTYNYTSLNGISSATTLEIWAECHPAGY